MLNKGRYEKVNKSAKGKAIKVIIRIFLRGIAKLQKHNRPPIKAKIKYRLRIANKIFKE